MLFRSENRVDHDQSESREGKMCVDGKALIIGGEEKKERRERGSRVGSLPLLLQLPKNRL